MGKSPSMASESHNFRLLYTAVRVNLLLRGLAAKQHDHYTKSMDIR
jgi:hypothetical protein